MMDGPIRPGDVVVSRVNGTSEFYVVGTVVSGKAGELMLRDTLTTNGREPAIGRAYTERQEDHRVWLFDGSAKAYVKTLDPETTTA
jgi:hypothetical protein